jgi:hypothetical protein
VNLGNFFYCVRHSPRLIELLCKEYKIHINNCLAQILQQYNTQKIQPLDMIERVIALYISFCQQAKILFQIDEKVDLHVEQALDKTFRTFLVEKLKKLLNTISLYF